MKKVNPKLMDYVWDFMFLVMATTLGCAFFVMMMTFAFLGTSLLIIYFFGLMVGAF